MQKLFLFVLMVCLPLFLVGCGSKRIVIPNSKNPSEIRFNTEEIMYVHGVGLGSPAYFGPKTIFFKYNPLDGIEKNGKKFLEKFESANGRVKLIVAHSYGTNLVVWAIENCSNLEEFKDVSILLLAPTLAGSKDAMGASGFFPQMTMSFINIFGQDYRTISADQDPRGSIIGNIWKYFSNFIQKTKKVICMTVSGDDYETINSSSEIIRENYKRLLSPFAIELSPRTKDPHNEILEREEVLMAMDSML